MTRFESLEKQFQDRQAAVAFVAGQKKDGPLGAGGYLEEHPLSHPYLLDQRREVIKAYGVYRPLGVDGIRTAHPSTFLIDASGRVRWIYVGENQKDRPAMEDVLNEIDKLAP